MKFKQFVTEIEAENENDIIDSLSVIKKELAQYTPEELIDFGYWLHDELFDDNDEEEFVYLDYDGIIELISELTSEDLEYVVYMMDSDSEEGSDEIDHYANTDSVEEGVKFKAKNRNKIKTKRFTVSKAQFRAGKHLEKEARKTNF